MEAIIATRLPATGNPVRRKRQRELKITFRVQYKKPGVVGGRLIFYHSLFKVSGNHESK